ncbi:IS6 family transposase [Brucella tritici]|uniref:IS6 family transposase n=1 Tax=Brucella tritici TaxID=94626 RepID=A0A7X6FRI5_9HYPH|nr:IS6 family transposase [Brucella tritici]KAB2662323.1 IS6 family transposase [Brucella tritici]NKW10661.1 IS6 family transposase [Brucella tritici]
MTVDFKGTHFPKSVILYAVFFYVRYSVSYRDLQEIMAERGIEIDHATLNRWVVRYSPQIAAQAQRRKRPTLGSWRVDETYIKIKGKWSYQYRAVDRDGQTLEFMLSERRPFGSARRFFKMAIVSNGVPHKLVLDESGANLAGAQAVNNILEQDHRFIKRITKPMMGFEAFHSAAATIAGIEVAHMIRKNQFANDNRSPSQVFAELAA